jgi:hypothetical protein
MMALPNMTETVETQFCSFLYGIFRYEQPAHTECLLPQNLESS